MSFELLIQVGDRPVPTVEQFRDHWTGQKDNDFDPLLAAFGQPDFDVIDGWGAGIASKEESDSLAELWRGPFTMLDGLRAAVFYYRNIDIIIKDDSLIAEYIEEKRKQGPVDGDIIRAFSEGESYSVWSQMLNAGKVSLLDMERAFTKRGVYQWPFSDLEKKLFYTVYTDDTYTDEEIMKLNSPLVVDAKIVLRYQFKVDIDSLIFEDIDTEQAKPISQSKLTEIRDTSLPLATDFDLSLKKTSLVAKV